MEIEKENASTIVLHDRQNGKKLRVRVNIDGNLDFYMSLEELKHKKEKSSPYFVIDSKNSEVYFATAKLFDNLHTKYYSNREFYNSRYKENPVYNEKHNCFKFHSDNENMTKYNFIRFFKHNGIYYIFFNQDKKEFNLSSMDSRYKEFSTYFNKYYSDLDKEYRSKKLKGDNREAKQVTFVNPLQYLKNSKIGD